MIHCYYCFHLIYDGTIQIKNIMDTFRVGDDLPIESKGVTDTLDKVQEKVENYNANIRQKVCILQQLPSIRAQRLIGECIEKRELTFWGDLFDLFCHSYRFLISMRCSISNVKSCTLFVVR